MKLNEFGKRAAGLVGVGLNRLFGSHARGDLGILVYHRIATAVPGVPKPTLNVSPNRFREQIAGLLDRGFVIWPLRKILQRRDEKRVLPPRTVVVTFDDGFEAIYVNAWPVLRELGIPATVFLSTAYLDSDGPFPFDSWGIAHQADAPAETYRPLRTLQCEEMAGGKLIDLGAHTHTHQDFRGLPQAFRQDLQTSVDVLRSRFAQRDVMFAYPYGRVYPGFAGGQLATAARQTGVICGLTTEAAPADSRSDPFQWGRFNVYDWDTAQTLAAKLAGWYSWAPRIEDWLSRPFRSSPDTPDASHHAPGSRERRRCSAASSTAEGSH